MSQLETYEVTYTPQYLTLEEYNRIISGSNGNKQGLGNPGNSGLVGGNGKGLYGKGRN